MTAYIVLDLVTVGLSLLYISVIVSPGFGFVFLCTSQEIG